MSGRPVPMGLRVLTPQRDRILCRRRRGELGTVRPRAAQTTPSSWFVDRMVGSSTKNWGHEELGQSEFSAARRRWRCGADPWAGRDAPGERRRNLPLKALIAERPFAVGGGAQRIKESRIERWPKQCPVCPAVGRRAAKLEIERLVGGQGVGGRQSARAVARPWVTRGCATIPARTGLSSM